MKTEFIVGSISAATFVLLQNKVEFILGPLTQSNQLPVPIGVSSAVLGFAAGFLVTKLTDYVRWMLLRNLLVYMGWITNTKSRRTKIYGLLLKLLSPKNPKLFDYQKILPRLPLPTLEETCGRIVDTVRPLLNEKELSEIKSAVKELQEVDGPKLHAVLQQRYKSEPNWLEEYWEKFAYLSARCPLPVNLNYSMLSQFEISDATQCARAANYTYYSMKYKYKIETQDLSPLRIMNLIPICMHRYNSLFSCTRLPGHDMDELKYYKSDHIIVFRNGHIYKVNMFCKNNRGNKVLMSPPAIQKVFESIIEKADREAVLNPAPFTTLDRVTWYNMRNKLMKSKRNMTSLEEVESAMFGVSLDNDNDDVSDPSGLFSKFLTGDALHRWFDKSFVIIARPNSAIGMNCEHTTAEATLYGRLWEYALCMQKYDDNLNAVIYDGSDSSLQSTPQELTWELDGFKDDITSAATAFEKTGSSIDCCVHLTTKGKGIMKKHRIGPDGFIQMAMQLAFYRQHKVTPKTYETASTRLFYHGRTDTIRSVSDESVLFTKTFDDSSVPIQEKVAHLRAAVSQQTKNKYLAMSGKAVDRHLFALYVTGKMVGKIPRLFSLKPFTENDRLSTSNSPITYDPKVTQTYEGEGAAGGGFGPQHAEGYGIAYFIVGEDKIHLIVSSYKSWSSAKQFAVDIEQAIDDQIQLLVDSKKETTINNNKKNI